MINVSISCLNKLLGSMTLLNKLQNTFSYKMRINSSLNQLSFFPPETGTSILYTVLEATQRTPLPSSW